MELSKLIYSPDFTKKQAERSGTEMIERLFEEGKDDPIQLFSNLARIKTIVDSADKKLRERLNLNGETSYNGVKFTPKIGSKKLNYDEDPVYVQLSEKVKEREKLLKVAHESKDVIFDSEGCEVPKVTSTFNKSSITITF